MRDDTLQNMQEFISLKVASGDHADMATQLTTLSTQGWDVVNIVSTGTDLIAYLSRSNVQPVPTAAVAPTFAPVDTAVGWASATGTSSQTVTPTTTPTTAPTSTPTVPADWYKDPSGRFEYRYWDGSKWTDNVSRAGVAYKDPPIP